MRRRSSARRQRSSRSSALALLLVVCASGPLAGCGSGSQTATATPSSNQEFDGAPLPSAVSAPGFTLTDVHGERVSLSAYRGQVTVLSFLYSDCRACVLIAQQIRGALDELPHPPPVLLVSVAPALDTPARVQAFLARVSLSGRVRYLIGPPAALAATWRAYGVRTPAAGQAAFESAAPVLLIDRKGRERVIYEQEQLTPEALAHDIGRLQMPSQPG